MTDSESLPQLKWLHLSDLHVGHGSVRYGIDQKLVLERLADDAIDQVRRGCVPAPDLILVTGDIADTGARRDRDEYSGADKWLGSLADELGVHRSDVLMVPGNHDADRYSDTRNRQLLRLLQCVRVHGEPLEDALARPAEKRLLEKRFKNYKEFSELWDGSASSGEAFAWSSERILPTGFKVRLAGINSAVLAGADDDKGKLQIALQQIQSSISAVEPQSDLMMLLTHHPFDWLRQGNAATVEPWFGSYVHLHLCGHLHVASAEHKRLSDGSETVWLRAGSVHGDEEGDRAHAYSFGGVSVDEQGVASVVYFPRRWTPSAGWTRDGGQLEDGQSYATFEFVKKLRAPIPVGTPALRVVSEQMLANIGDRRTAYPTDLSIAELVDKGLIIDSELLVPESGSVEVPFLLEAVHAKKNILVLGAPGSGKSVLTYILHRRILESGESVPLQLRANTLPQVADGSEDSIASALGVSSSDLEGAGDLVVFVDAIDEAMASGLSVSDLVRALTNLRSVGTLIVSCRRTEFERELAGVIDPDAFDVVIDLQPWTQAQFAAYTKSLSDAGLLADRDVVVSEVNASEVLTSLVSRPLFARMITFVAGRDAELLGSATDLYGTYLSQLAATLDGRLKDIECADVHVVERWEELAWYLFVQGRFSANAVPGALPTQLLVEAGMTASCAQVICAALLEYEIRGSELTAGFRHYTFFEYLVAAYVNRQVNVRRTDSNDEFADLFENDLPLEIRHHLTRMLTGADWGESLVHQFTNLPQDEGKRRTVGNLVAYYLGRSNVDPVRIRQLLAEEEDAFLRTSLYWALANAGDEDAMGSYFDELENSSGLMAQLNRGYLMYYYGDIVQKDPPFLDSDSTSPWDRTRAKTLGLLAQADYSTRETAARRVLDLWTLVDFFQFHRSAASPAEILTLGETLEELRSVVPKLVERVDERWPK